MNKQVEKVMDNNNTEQEKVNKQLLVDKNAYIRVNQALKVVIPSSELQEFKQCFDNAGILSEN